MRGLIILSMLAGAAAAAVHFGLVKPPFAVEKADDGLTTPAIVPADAPAAEVVVTVVPATAREVQRRVRTVGTLHGFEEIDISALVDGRVAKVVHDVGDVVDPGETLLEIDAADYRLAVQEVGRGLELELAALGLSTVPDGSFDISALPSVERARIVERSAAETLLRYQGLAERSAMTKDELQKAELAFDTARLDHRQRLIEAEQTLAAVRHRQAVLETSQKRLADTRVVAPVIEIRSFPVPGAAAATIASEAGLARSFTVAARLVSEGEVVRAAPPMALFRLVIEDVLKLKASVPERYAAQVKPGQEVDLAVESLPGRPVSGHVVRVNPTIDTASRTFDIEVQVPNPDRELKAGSFAKASILLATVNDAVTVPEEALVRFAGVTKLFTVVDGLTVVIPVETGIRLDVAAPGGVQRRWIEVLGGVPAGALVVTSGHAQIGAGTQVRIREPAGSVAR